MTIELITLEKQYILIEDKYKTLWTAEMFEGLVEEEVDLIPKFGEYSDNEPLDVPTMTTDFVKEHGLPCPEGYQFVDENGNEILASKIILKKKKKEYPKTYEECCEIIHSDPKFYVDTHLYSGILGALYRLLICRNAYWKIAGQEMELDGPWEPDWNDEKQDKYGFHNEVQYTIINSTLFVFPTSEMRDAFKENFDSDIENCK